MRADNSRGSRVPGRWRYFVASERCAPRCGFAAPRCSPRCSPSSNWVPPNPRRCCPVGTWVAPRLQPGLHLGCNLGCTWVATGLNPVAVWARLGCTPVAAPAQQRRCARGALRRGIASAARHRRPRLTAMQSAGGSSTPLVQNGAQLGALLRGFVGAVQSTEAAAVVKAHATASAEVVDLAVDTAVRKDTLEVRPHRLHSFFPSLFPQPACAVFLFRRSSSPGLRRPSSSCQPRT